MADVQALLKDCRIKGTIIIKAGPDDGKQITYKFSADGMGNIIGAWESDYEYNQDTRMKFSILRDMSAEGQWKHDYVIGVLANLEGIDDSLCERSFESKTGLPAGSATVDRINVDDALAEGHQEYMQRQRQYQRLGIDGRDPSTVFLRSMRREPRTDIELFIAKAVRVFSSLQLIISLSQGFRLSEIYRNIADGIDDGGLSFYHDANEASADNADDDASDDLQSSEVADEFNGIDWNHAIDEQDDADMDMDTHPDGSTEPDDDAADDSDNPDNDNPDDSEPSSALQADAGVEDTGLTIMSQDDDTDMGETAEDDNSAYESIIANPDENDEFDMEQDNPMPTTSEQEHDTADSHHNTDDADGDIADSNVRDDVHKYMDEKIRSIDENLSDYDRKIQNAENERDSIVDESDSLKSLKQSISEEKARLESMEEREQELEKSVNEAIRRRSELDDRLKSYADQKKSLEHDRSWLQSLRRS